MQPDYSKYKFTLEHDPEGEDGFYSVFVDNGEGCSAELAGRIGNKAVAEVIVGALQLLEPMMIRAVFENELPTAKHLRKTKEYILRQLGR